MEVQSNWENLREKPPNNLFSEGFWLYNGETLLFSFTTHLYRED